jgi:hypothetical protein
LFPKIANLLAFGLFVFVDLKVFLSWYFL